MLHRNQKFGLALRLFAIAALCFWLLSAITTVVVAVTTISDIKMLGAEQDLSFVEEIEQPEQIKQLINTPIEFPELIYEIFYDIDKSNAFLAIITNRVNQLDIAMQSDDYTVEAVDLMLQEKSRLLDVAYQVGMDVKHYISWENEHYYAAKVWLFLKQQGYSNAVTSGIIGNMMVETGGGTLNLVPNVFSSSGRYYGLCQWSLKYRPSVANMSFEDQLSYLMEDIEPEFETFGFCYKTNFSYDSFLSLKKPEQAAKAFAKVYERCGSRSYTARQKAAKKAYNYFDLDKDIE